MFEKLFSYMNSVDFKEHELNWVISIDSKGNDATLGDLICQNAPLSVLATFSHTPKQSGVTIKAVHELSDKEIEHVVMRHLKTFPKDRALAIAGYGFFTGEQLREEVKQKTEVGRCYIAIVRSHNMFLEKAIKEGKIRRKSNKGNVEIPNFNF